MSNEIADRDGLLEEMQALISQYEGTGSVVDALHDAMALVRQRLVGGEPIKLRGQDDR